METLYIELTADEIKVISGGNVYEAGKKVGKWCADFVDFWDGFFTALLN